MDLAMKCRRSFDTGLDTYICGARLDSPTRWDWLTASTFHSLTAKSVSRIRARCAVGGLKALEDRLLYRVVEVAASSTSADRRSTSCAAPVHCRRQESTAPVLAGREEEQLQDEGMWWSPAEASKTPSANWPEPSG